MCVVQDEETLFGLVSLETRSVCTSLAVGGTDRAEFGDGR